MQNPIVYTLVDRAEALPAALADLAASPSLALDMEMENSYHHYGLHIALIQISTAQQKHYIFDPLAAIDIQPLGALLTGRRKELILHDADFDLRACHQIYRWKLKRLFDTKLAAQLCGYRRFGLGHLLRDLLRIQVDKKFQTFDWMQRPLPPAALDYAARDTASLHALQTILTERLVALGRWTWAQEEFQRLERYPPRETPVAAHLRIKRSSLLTPRQLAVLHALTTFRDQMARNINRPVHYVIQDALLVQLAVQPPANAKALRAMRGMHPLIYRAANTRQLLEALAQGQAAPEEIHPQRRQRPPSQAGYAQRLKALQEWRRARAKPLDLEPFLIWPNDALQWCARHPQEPLPADVASQIRAWQQEMFGDDFQRQCTKPPQP